MSLAPPPLQAWRDLPPVWARWFRALFARVGGSSVGGGTDVTLAPLASPAFTGTPTAPTAAVDTNSTRLATTAFVLGQAASEAPAMDGSAAAGASTRYARADHVHPSDTSRAPLASPALTGTPTAPTPAAGDNSTKIATTAFVATALSRATVDVTAGSRGSAALVGAAVNVASVSIVSVTVAAGPITVYCVRLTFSSAMADTNYVAIPARESLGASDPAAYVATNVRIVEKNTAYCTVGFVRSDANTYYNMDDATHRFSVLVYR